MRDREEAPRERSTIGADGERKAPHVPTDNRARYEILENTVAPAKGSRRSFVRLSQGALRAGGL